MKQATKSVKLRDKPRGGSNIAHFPINTRNSEFFE